jgi:hypothetical protein
MFIKITHTHTQKTTLNYQTRNMGNFQGNNTVIKNMFTRSPKGLSNAGKNFLRLLSQKVSYIIHNVNVYSLISSHLKFYTLFSVGVKVFVV